MEDNVVYNGSKETWNGCSSASLLEKGRKYEVVGKEVNTFQTNLILKEFPGEKFNSAWFNEVTDCVRNVYLAVAKYIPVVGEKLFAYKVVYRNGFPDFMRITTSDVRKVEKISRRIYKVTTHNSTYFVQVF